MPGLLGLQQLDGALGVAWIGADRLLVSCEASRLVELSFSAAACAELNRRRCSGQPPPAGVQWPLLGGGGYASFVQETRGVVLVGDTTGRCAIFDAAPGAAVRRGELWCAVPAGGVGCPIVAGCVAVAAVGTAPSLIVTADSAGLLTGHEFGFLEPLWSRATGDRFVRCCTMSDVASVRVDFADDGPPLVIDAETGALCQEAAAPVDKPSCSPDALAQHGDRYVTAVGLYVPSVQRDVPVVGLNELEAAISGATRLTRVSAAAFGGTASVALIAAAAQQVFVCVYADAD
jgi:hypothetical protein